MKSVGGIIFGKSETPKEIGLWNRNSQFGIIGAHALAKREVWDNRSISYRGLS